MINWSKIETVFLDMDGTLLDLHFDNYFWQQFVPAVYAKQHDLTIDEAKQELVPKFRAHESTLNWYCVDFWSEQLGLDIVDLKHQLSGKIRLRPYTIEFLEHLQNEDVHIALMTNAHPKTVSVKMHYVDLTDYFHSQVMSHHIGIPKEHEDFWQRLHDEALPFDPATTVLIDDSLPVLRSARQYGIAHLFSIAQPDSKLSKREIDEFEAIHSFTQLMT